MNIEVKLSMEKAFEDSPYAYTGTKLASGYIEIESAFKFPVSILRSNKDGKNNMFIKFPTMPKGDGGYNNIVFPVDSAVRTEVENAVFEELKKLTLKGLDNPLITNVRVTALSEPLQSGSISIKGYASIMVSGFAINGISIKEGNKGLFVQMPQYRDGNGQYHDIAYGTNSAFQETIKAAVLETYQKTMKEIAQKEKQVEISKNKENKYIQNKNQVSPKL